jgi:hypothetical protein
MTWSLSASGHTADAEHEKELHDELHKVLSNPKFGATGSSFSGNHVTGAVHVRPVAEPATEPEHAHAEHPTEHHHHTD